ncbi:MAG TPA: amidohydrolase family protein, partial [Pirellulales bacterium]|nr:amidohydrolase family protein [Pirellulales bacterium]
LLHMDNVRNTDVPGLPGLEKVLKTYASVSFIGHALGIWSSISGDISQKELGAYPRGKVQPGGALDRLLDTYDNLYCDLSAGSGANAIRRDPDFMRQFILRHPKRILFGTDYLDPSMTPDQFELIDELKLPDDVFRKVASDNASTLLGLG